MTELRSTGTATVDRLMLNVNYAIPQKRFFMGGNYQFGHVKNFTDNPFTLPADNYDLERNGVRRCGTSGTGSLRW